MPQVFTLNKTGRAIIETFDGKKTLKAITSKPLKQFDVKRSMLKDNLQQFITEAIDK